MDHEKTFDTLLRHTEEFRGDVPVRVTVDCPNGYNWQGSLQEFKEALILYESSLLRVFPFLPEDERKILGQSCYRIAQWRRSEQAALLIPEKVRKYYDAQFSLGMSRKSYQFVGFACNSCNRWIECGHDDNCAVGDLMPKNFDYKSIHKKMMECK